MNRTHALARSYYFWFKFLSLPKEVISISYARNRILCHFSWKMKFGWQNNVKIKKDVEPDFRSFFFVTLKMETNYIYVTIIIHFQNNPVSYSSSSLNGLNSLFFLCWNSFIISVWAETFYFAIKRRTLNETEQQKKSSFKIMTRGKSTKLRILRCQKKKIKWNKH